MRLASDCGWVDYLQDIGGQPPPPDALGQAVDSAHLKFSTGGDASWFAQTAVYYYDNDAAQSGPIGDNQESWLQTTVEGTGTVRFWWKVSCDAGDGFAFYVDDQYIFGRQGGADWQEYPYTINTSGTHTLKWRYFKGSSGSSGSDCAWVDYVRWSGSVPDPNGWQTITYTYDPAGRRIEKKYDGTTVMKYLYDGDHCIAESDGSDNLLRKYIFGPGIDEPVSMIDVEDSNATYYYHFDALGSVIALTNSSGSTVELYEYSVFGQVAASDANIPNRFMFTGREFDADTGLYYYRARYYNPEIGRFLQTDPVGYGDGMNWYAYCGNSPGSHTDPRGLKANPDTPYAYVYVDDRCELLVDETRFIEGHNVTSSWNIYGVARYYGVPLEAITIISGTGGIPTMIIDRSVTGDLVPSANREIRHGGTRSLDDYVAALPFGPTGAVTIRRGDGTLIGELSDPMPAGGLGVSEAALKIDNVLWISDYMTPEQLRAWMAAWAMAQGVNKAQGWGAVAELLARWCQPGGLPTPPPVAPPTPAAPPTPTVGPAPVFIFGLPNLQLILQVLLGEYPTTYTGPVG
jgi:RHS repeat-associated protein